MTMMRAAIAALGLAAACATSAWAESSAPQHAAGQAVYLRWCAPCHAPGVTHPGTHALTTKYQGIKSGVLIDWLDLPAVTVKYWVRHGISVMPQFRKTEISDAELDELAGYLARNTPGG